MKKIFLQLLILSFAVIVRLKYSVFVVLIGAGLFLSCSKPKWLPQTPPPPPPSLSGQEFLIDSLPWIFLDGRFDVGIDEIYLQTTERPDLFPWFTYSTYLNAEVLLKFDTASNWINVKSVDINDPAIPVQYQYWINLRCLFVHLVPLNYQLIGRKASIKIKFL
ncbi:MAG TPA: hypothetical protein VHQ93_01095 [Chitinophagaceae bacterium]|jgi:hypothetical protein|nr:hypothetical protein [Chitinophagaceae bacterium]